MPDHRTIWRWMNSDESFCERYARAIQSRALAHADAIDDLAHRVETGQLPPDAGRVAIDAKKWVASRLLPKVYGDRQQVEATVTHTHQLHLEALKQLAEQGRGTRSGYNEPQVIDIAANPTFLPEMHGAKRGGDPQQLSPAIGEEFNQSGSTSAITPPGTPTPGGVAMAAAPPPSVQKKSKRKKGNGDDQQG